MEWIKIEEQLPAQEQKVFAFRPYAHELGDDNFTILKYNGYLAVDHRGNTYGFERGHYVSHWQPLVKPE